MPQSAFIPSIKLDPATTTATVHLDWDLFTNELEFE
jgi:hypothetical protein